MISAGDVVLVPFPFVEGKGHKWRPALVISASHFHKKYAMCWVVMITSAENEAWAGDIPLMPLKNTGLTSASVIRPAKIAALQLEKAEKIEAVTPVLLKKALAFVTNQLPL